MKTKTIFTLLLVFTTLVFSIKTEAKSNNELQNNENAYGSIFASIGIDTFPIDVESENIEQLTNSIRDYFEGISLHDQFFSMKIK